MQKFKLVLGLLALSFLASCGEETIAPTTQSTTFTTTDIQTFDVSTCSQMRLEKPPVDILYVIDNSGSTVAGSFQSIKAQIQNTVYNISNEFDYHVYFAPLNAGPSDSINGYPLIVSNPSSLPSTATVNITSVENLNMFAQASGNNEEYGFQRVKNIIDHNRSNGIFRNNSNTIVIMISNGDDTQSLINVGGNRVYDASVFNNSVLNFKKYTKKYAQSSSVSNPMNAESFRFLSLVAHNSCNSWTPGVRYKDMSKQLYDYQGFSDNNSAKDSVDLCSQNYTSLFSAVNNSIRSVIVGHKYDHWKISSSSASNIQEDDITVHKVMSDGSQVAIPRSATDGFEYLGYRSNQNTRYEPDTGEPQTGLMIKLNGSARVAYPDCIIAKTRTPTEYFGYIVLPRDPDLSSMEIKIDGVKYNQSNANGWTYDGWKEAQNIKVGGPTGASVLPADNKTGYFIKLHGNAIYTNGQTISVYYKPKVN